MYMVHGAWYMCKSFNRIFNGSLSTKYFALKAILCFDMD